MVERLVANEKVEGSTPFARSIFIVIKSKLITSIFQKFLTNKDIRIFRNSYFYYILFRLIRNFLISDIVIKIYNFKVFGSVNRNKTSYFLLKKCDFGDHHEIDLIKKISENNRIIFFDCGCNYGFYSLYVASLSNKNKIISIDASKKTLENLEKNIQLNKFSNINIENKAISDVDDNIINFNESKKDWESSLVHNNFKSHKKINIKTTKIDSLALKFDQDKFYPIIKLDVEGNEINALKGSLSYIKKKSPLIIIEFSKYTLDTEKKIENLYLFLLKYDYCIYDTNNKKQNLEDIQFKLKKLKKRFMTIGNFYLIKNSSEILKEFVN